MKHNLLRNLVTFIILTSSLTLMNSGQAASLAYHVEVTTATLVGNSAGPFSLDFQLTDGSGTFAVPNTVNLSNFTFNGGGPLGTSTLTLGASGSLSSSISLTDTFTFPTEFFQAFTPGTTLGFDVLTTSNVDPGPTPDAFSFGILDKNLANIPTTGLGDSLLLFNMNSASPVIGAVQTFASVNPAGVTVTASPIPSVPEPSNALVGVILVSICCYTMLSRHKRPDSL